MNTGQKETEVEAVRTRVEITKRGCNIAIYAGEVRMVVGEVKTGWA